MKEKKFTPLMWCHLIMMVVLMVMSAVTAIVYFAGTATPGFKAYFDEWALPIYGFAIWNIVNILALGCGIVYLLRRYTKKAAGFFRAFLLLSSLAALIMLLINALSPDSDVATYIMGIKFAALITLAVWKDLGKQKSWFFFAVIVAADLVFDFFVPNVEGTLIYRLSTALSRLFVDGTIGLAIKGKYDDKDARGTV